MVSPSPTPDRRHRVLVVDDDELVARSLAEFLRAEGYDTATALSAPQAMDALDAANGSPFALMLCDVNMPQEDGLKLLRRVRKRHDQTAVIMVTGYGKIEKAVEAIKLGASDYLTKPLIDDELRISVNKALQQHALLAENKALRSQLEQRFGLENVVIGDYRMQKVYDLVEAVADSTATVLIEGESGTGKSMIARAIHLRSPRRGGPFVTMSCGAVPEALLESELFGHVKGAFTGADLDKPGKLLAAQGGTMLIDEINSATPALQLKLLRVLQDRQYEPVGSTKTMTADVRFVLATNRVLSDLVREGSFREDLFYRINVVNVRMPPLRERPDDIPLLAEHFLKRFCDKNARQRKLGDAAMAALKAYPWPGNVRELENALERAVILSRQLTIQPEDLPDTVTAGRPMVPASPARSAIPAIDGGWTPTPLAHALAEPERQILLAALQANGWNRQLTAAQLDINRTTLYKKIKQYRLDEPPLP